MCVCECECVSVSVSVCVCVNEGQGQLYWCQKVQRDCVYHHNKFETGSSVSEHKPT